MTGELINAGGIPLVTPNTITAQNTDFYISYNDRDRHIYGDVTTALVSENPIKFLILNGNHTEQYAKIISNGGDYEDCVQYFRENESLKAKYSENWDEVLIIRDGTLVAVKDERYIK